MNPTTTPLTDPIALADELERLLLEVANGERKPKDLPLEPFVRAHQKLRELAKAAEPLTGAIPSTPPAENNQATVQAALAVVRMNGLRRLCGYVENGSDTVVTIFQDDATRGWCVRVGIDTNLRALRFYGDGFLDTLDAAIAGTPKEEWED